MRVMVIVKANKDSEGGVMPSEKLLAEMGKFNQELMKAGVLLGADGLRPSAKGKRVRFSDGKKIVLSDQSPFSEHLKTLESVSGLSEFVLKHAKPPDHYQRAFLMELVLEGLVQNLRIAREDLDSTLTYAELAKFNLMRSRG